MKCPQHNKKMDYQDGFWKCKYFHCGTIVRDKEKEKC